MMNQIWSKGDIVLTSVINTARTSLPKIPIPLEIIKPKETVEVQTECEEEYVIFDILKEFAIELSSRCNP